MAGANCVTPLLVRVFPPYSFAEKLEAKLAIYFQSPKKSGGGECDVKVKDRERGIYSVWFRSEEVKKRVKAHHRGHTIEVSGNTLEIRILQDSELTLDDASKTVFTNNAMGSLSTSLSSNFLSLQNDFKKKQEEIYAAGHESGRKKIFLEVSATLNTDLFTNEQRNQVIAAYPTLQIERASSRFGIEKVMGHYEDIDKLHCHFEKLLLNHCDNEFLQAKKQDSWVEDHNRRCRSDLEELANMEVPSGIFEYFGEAYKEEIKKIEEAFNVKLVTGSTENGITSVWFASTRGPNFSKKAQEEFVLLFQKVAGDLKQEEIPLIESHEYEMIKSKCKHVLIKNNKDAAVLQGPTKEVSGAKALLNEMTAKNRNKKNDPHLQPTGIEVDAAVFALLKPRLNQKIELINNRYCTRMMEQHCRDDHLTRIIFMPQSYASSDQSSQASDVFQYEYLMCSEMPQVKGIPLKSLEGSKRKLEDLFTHCQHEHPKVELTVKENYLFMYGLPEDILFVEKNIMKALNSEDFVAVNSEATAIPDSIVGAAIGPSFGSPRRHNMQQVPSQEQPVGYPMEVQPEERCPLCLKQIYQKEVLPKCKHAFCAACIGKAMNYKPDCPQCNFSYGNIKHPTEQTEVIMKSRNSENFGAVNSEARAIPDSSVGAATGTSFELQRYHKTQLVPSQEPPVGKASEVQPDESCPICLNQIHQKEVLPKCKHAFCAACIGTAMNYKPVCPVCNVVYGDIKGNQPPGKMEINKTRSSLPGHKNSGTITITYRIFDGIQTERHPHPGKPFFGTSRIAYLPDNKEGREILKLLQRAFDQGLVFTVGQSRTTGANDVVTWNDIHHKTSTHGGEKNFGYPDSNYLKRVREELKAKGIE